MVMPAVAPPIDVPTNNESVDPTVHAENGRRSLKDVVVELTKSQPGLMLGLAFTAGAVWVRLRR